VIGANAVVLTDVPPHSIAVGIPAKIRPRKSLDPWREECASIQGNSEELRTAKVC
jgi:serine acetyltransferase